VAPLLGFKSSALIAGFEYAGGAGETPLKNDIPNALQYAASINLEVKWKILVFKRANYINQDSIDMMKSFKFIIVESPIFRLFPDLI